MQKRITDKLIVKQIKSFPKAFWILNLMQMAERLAFWVALLQLPIYIAQKDASGGLHWEQTTKGLIYFWWALMQNLTPVFAGGFADRYGYKRVMRVSYGVIILGYLFLATQRVYLPFLIGTLILGFGSGVFKPALQGAIARTLDGRNSSVGWGIYVMLVNAAVFLGPPLAIYLKGISWFAVFGGCALIISLNYLLVLLFRDKSENDKQLTINEQLKDTPLNPLSRGEIEHRNTPPLNPLSRGEIEHRNTPPINFLSSGEIEHRNTPPINPLSSGGFDNEHRNDTPLNPISRGEIKGWFDILKKTFHDLLRPKLFVFILLMSGFTIIYMQFYETLPNFIVDWVDTSALVKNLHLPSFMLSKSEHGTILAYEWLYNINSFMIVIGVVLVSWALSKAKGIIVIIFGIIIASAGLMLCGISMSGYYTVAGFMLYTLGEMTTNPRFNEFLGKIAPANEKAQYMSYLNISWAVGLGGGSLLGGYLYRHIGEKSGLALRYLNENLHVTNQVNSQNAFQTLKTAMGLDGAGLTKYLWDFYKPYQLWLPFLIIGIISAIGIMIYYFKVLKKELENNK